MGLIIQRRLHPEGLNPLSSCSWTRRDIAIKDHRGETVFEQENVAMPAHFSDLAAQIIASKYFRGALGSPEREYSLSQVILRVVSTILDWGVAGSYFETPADAERFGDELTMILLHQYACFNSPVLFNLGVPNCEQQASACFILKAEDTMEGWMRVAREEAFIFKRGSGAGIDLSPIRSSWERLSGGGWASGPLSLARILDTAAGQIKSGGRVRRAAKMHVLRVDHPDILETREGGPGFVPIKADEENAARALIDAGYDGGFGVPGGAYSRVAFQNVNHSVRAPGEFFRAVEEGGPWETHDRFGKVEGVYQAAGIHDAICQAAWECGDPAYQYDDAIQGWNTLPNSGRINASNPCAEYLGLDNTSCNLASINLVKFLKEDGSWDTPLFEHVCKLLIVAQDIISGAADYPTPEIRAETLNTRPLGLGYCNLGALLMRMGLPYDSEEGRQMAGAVTSLLAATAYEMSAEIAAHKGAFPYFEANHEPMMNVIAMHRDASWDLQETAGRETRAGRIAARATATWMVARMLGMQFGFRNSQVCCIAPTGTIAFWLDADTTGIEPDLSLIKTKHLAGGGELRIVNQSVRAGLRALGYGWDLVGAILADLETDGHLEGSLNLNPAHLPVFDCAFMAPGGSRSIHYRAHLLMMAAVQLFVSGSISKTINMPASATPEDISAVFLEGWRLGLKCVSVYRDGSKRSQPLSSDKGRKRKKAGASPLMTCPDCQEEFQPGASEKCFTCPNCGLQSGCSV